MHVFSFQITFCLLNRKRTLTARSSLVHVISNSYEFLQLKEQFIVNRALYAQHFFTEVFYSLKGSGNNTRGLNITEIRGLLCRHCFIHGGHFKF